MRKAHSLSLDLILKAAVAFLSLLLLGGVFIGNFMQWKNQVKACIPNGGVCVPNEIIEGDKYKYCSEYEYKITLDYKCYTEGYRTEDTTKICCISAK